MFYIYNINDYFLLALFSIFNSILCVFFFITGITCNDARIVSNLFLRIKRGLSIQNQYLDFCLYNIIAIKLRIN